MLLGVLEVSEQRLGLVGRADLQVLAHRQRIDRREKDRVAHDAGDRMDDQLVSTGNADHGSATRVRAVLGASAPAAAARRGGDGLGHLLGAPAMSVAMSVPVAFMAAMFVIFVATVTMPTATLSMPMAMLSVPVATVAMSVTSMAAMAFFTVSVPAATAAALGGGDVRVYQLKLLPISHVSSFNPATRARSLG